MSVPVAVWQPCQLLYTCYLLTYLLRRLRAKFHYTRARPDRTRPGSPTKSAVSLNPTQPNHGTQPMSIAGTATLRTHCYQLQHSADNNVGKLATIWNKYYNYVILRFRSQHAFDILCSLTRCVYLFLLFFFKFLVFGAAIYANKDVYDTIRYDTRFYINVRSKANMSQLNLPHGTDK